MKRVMSALLIVFLALQLLVPGWQVFRHYHTLLTGEDCKFIVAPYDPYDPFRGRYVALRAAQEIDGEDEYLLLGEDAQGYAMITGQSTERPDQGLYVKGLDLGRYYMNEAMAPEAERIQRELSGSDTMYLLVKVKNGHYVIEGLYLNGVPIEECIAAG